MKDIQYTVGIPVANINERYMQLLQMLKIS